jgi:hypothetical protein
LTRRRRGTGAQPKNSVSNFDPELLIFHFVPPFHRGKPTDRTAASRPCPPQFGRSDSIGEEFESEAMNVHCAASALFSATGPTRCLNSHPAVSGFLVSAVQQRAARQDASPRHSSIWRRSNTLLEEAVDPAAIVRHYTGEGGFPATEGSLA